MEKKGASHLELILAFTLFVLTLTFLFIYIKPTNQTRLPEVVLTSLENGFLKNATVELITIFSNESCIPKEINLNSINKSVLDRYHQIFASEEFNSGLDDCSSEFLGSISSERILSNKSLRKLEEGYLANYSNIKKILKVPETFEFEIYSEDKEFNMSRGEIGDAGIISNRHLFKVLYSDGEIKNKYFIFRIW